jgi:hypothetical protein
MLDTRADFRFRIVGRPLNGRNADIAFRLRLTQTDVRLAGEAHGSSAVSLFSDCVMERPSLYVSENVL